MQRTVIVFGTDRSWRLACDTALRARGMRPRLASRPAELVKCLQDAVAPLVVIDGPLPRGVTPPDAVVVPRVGREPGAATVERVDAPRAGPSDGR